MSSASSATANSSGSQHRFDYDLYVIGGGSGGVRASRIAAGYGAQVGLCEESRLGGTCVIRGCVPKKLLMFASQFSESFSDAAGYGWQVGESAFNWSDLVAAKEREITRLESVYGSLLGNAGVEVHTGRGVLVDAHTVEVAGQRYTAEKILIAVGGRPAVPDLPGAELAIISDDAFDLPELPQKILVIGGGYIAVEFAGIFKGLGADVTLSYRRQQILRGFDQDVRRCVEAGMRGRGIEFRYDDIPVRIESIAGDDGQERRRVHFKNGSQFECDLVMWAVGRNPYTATLGLEHAGVETTANGVIPVDQHSRTNVESIYAVGDVTDRIQLTPVALMEGHAFADTEFSGQLRTVDHNNVPSAVFSQPPAASVGFTEHEARAHLNEIAVFRSEFTPMKYTLSGRQEKAMMKLIVESDTDRVVGMHLVGPDSAEILQGFAVAVRAGLTKADFDRTIGIHPTSAEELVTLRQPV